MSDNVTDFPGGKEHHQYGRLFEELMEVVDNYRGEPTVAIIGTLQVVTTALILGTHNDDE